LGRILFGVDSMRQVGGGEAGRASDQEPVSNSGMSAEADAPVSGGPGTDGKPSQRDDEPDVRFTYANERTFLAWNRTALALIATGVAATQLLPKLQVEWGRRLLGLPLIALGAVVAAESLRQWRANQRAMRRGEPLPRSWMPLVLTIGIVAIGAIAVAIAALGTG
jgi:putative membrane protein